MYNIGINAVIKYYPLIVITQLSKLFFSCKPNENVSLTITLCLNRIDWYYKEVTERLEKWFSVFV